MTFFYQIYSRDFHPSILVADGATEETYGFQLAYCTETDGIKRELEGRIMCWVHLLRNVDKRLKSVNQRHRANLKSDIYTLQIARNREIFNKAVDLHNQKYNSVGDETVNNFLNYLNNE